MGAIFSVGDFFDMLRRRYITVLAVTCLGCALSLLFAWMQSHQYASSEVLQMQHATIPNATSPASAQGSSARRLQLIEQQVMSRGAILEMIEELGLFRDQPSMSEVEKVAAIRRAVRIASIAAVRQGYSDDGELSLLRISADWPTALGAQRLAHDVSRRTMSLSVSTQLDQSRETLDFYLIQEEASLHEMQALEVEIAQFIAENHTTLPGAAIGAQRELETLNEQILSLDRQMITLQRQIALPAESRVERRDRAQYQAELDVLTEERALLAGKSTVLHQSIEDMSQTQRQSDDYARRLASLRVEVEAAIARRKNAETAYHLETQRQSDHLTVLEPAFLPEYPYTRARKTLALMGAVASLFAGVSAAFLKDLCHPVIRSAAQLEHALGLRPVVSIPQMKPQKPARRGPLA